MLCDVMSAHKEENFMVVLVSSLKEQIHNCLLHLCGIEANAHLCCSCESQFRAGQLSG